MTSLRAAWFLARKDVQYMLRARETLLWTFVMPIVFFYFIGTITAGFGGGPAREVLGLDAPADAGFLVDQVAARLAERGFEVARPETREDAARYRRRLEFPPGFTASVLGGERATVRFVRRGQGIGTDYDRLRVARALYTVLADVAVTAQAGEEPDPAAFERLREAPRALSLEVVPAGPRLEPPGGFEQAIPGTTVMFTILVLLTSGTVLLVIERREGVLRRLAVAPVPRGAVVLGKWGGRMALGLVQIAFALGAGTLLFGMDWGPHPLVALLYLSFYAGLVACLGLLLGSLARTEGQAIGIGVLAANLLGALGGCWWPIEITPRWMQTFSLFLPTGWAMDALHKLVVFGAPVSSVVPHFVGTALAALVAGWLAARLFRFQ